MGLDKISTLKKELGLTTDELARLANVPKGTLDKILSGVTKDPKLETLKAIARVLNCSLNDFDDNQHVHIELKTDVDEAIEILESLSPDLKDYALQQIKLIKNLQNQLKEGK